MIVILQREYSTKEELVEEKKKKARRKLLYSGLGLAALGGIALYAHHKSKFPDVKIKGIPTETEEQLAARREKKSEEIIEKAMNDWEKFKAQGKEKVDKYTKEVDKIFERMKNGERDLLIESVSNGDMRFQAPSDLAFKINTKAGEWRKAMEELKKIKKTNPTDKAKISSLTKQIDSLKKEFDNLFHQRGVSLVFD
jgi:capsule polysaccharide export protein KpsE/RkpR